VWKLLLTGSGGVPLSAARFEVPSKAEIKQVQKAATILHQQLTETLKPAEVLLLVGGFYAEKNFLVVAQEKLQEAQKLAPVHPLIAKAVKEVEMAMGWEEQDPNHP
jgi:hypothetical protein